MFKFRRRKFSAKRKNLVFDKPNTKIRRILFFVEVALVILVVLGVGWSLGRVFKFSPDFFGDSLGSVFPKGASSLTPTKTNDKTQQILNNLPTGLFTLKNVKRRTADYLVVVSKQKTTVVFSLNKNINFQLTTLQNILTKAKINRRGVSRVDLRFDKIVVVYN